MLRELTRPIPGISVGAISRRLAAYRLGTMLAGDEVDTAVNRELDETPMGTANAEPHKIRATAAHYIPQDAIRAAALAVLMHWNPGQLAPAAAGEFLAGVEDSGVSRPMIDFNEVKAKETPALSRAKASMQPWTLSKEDAEIVSKSLASGSARPKIKITALPQYDG